MTAVIQSMHLLVIVLAGWLNRHQQAFIDYLIEGNRSLKVQLDGQRLRFAGKQRMRLAVKDAGVADYLKAHLVQLAADPPGRGHKSRT